MQLAIRYVSRFVYDEPIRESHNMLRACPADTDRQRLLSYRVRTYPASRVVTFTDYWGTRVDAFGITDPHTSLEVIAEAQVETQNPDGPGDVVDIGVDAFSDELRRRHGEYLQQSRHTRWNRRLIDMAYEAIAGHTTAVEAIGAIEDVVRKTLEYAPGSTYIGVDVSELLDSGAGVCQDFAHLGIALCRSVGMPARYVSGYLYATDQATGDVPQEAEVEIQTHAWYEVLVPGWGWWALDPTNPGSVGERHVKIGHGRDYDDVMPLRGVYHGDPEHELGVSVHISRDTLSAIQSQQ